MRNVFFSSEYELDSTFGWSFFSFDIFVSIVSKDQSEAENGWIYLRIWVMWCEACGNLYDGLRQNLAFRDLISKFIFCWLHVVSLHRWGLFERITLLKVSPISLIMCHSLFVACLMANTSKAENKAHFFWIVTSNFTWTVFWHTQETKSSLNTISTGKKKDLRTFGPWI